MNLIRRCIIIIIFLIIIDLAIIGPITALDTINTSNKSCLFIVDILDQKQELQNREINIKNQLLVAQEFKPSMTPLTKVVLKIRKTVVIEAPLIVSIRKDLNKSDLTAIAILGPDIPFNTFWVEFDFEDIEVNIEETYYIVLKSTSSQSYWLQTKYNTSSQGDPYNRGKLWESNNNGIDWESLDDSNSFFDCTFKTYSYISKSDLDCEGTLIWTNITPKSVITGSFIVKNIGTPFSYLNWKIYNWPSWGQWTFSSSNGNNLKPEDGPFIIQVTINTPNATNAEYSGKLKIINLDDEEDYCIINCALSTPKSNFYDTKVVKFFELIKSLKNLKYQFFYTLIKYSIIYNNF